MNFFSSAKNNIYNTYVNAVNAVTPALSVSKFYEEGVLTPEEFVLAGDLLTYKCPTWRWEAGEPSRRVSYLPADKQYLVTKNVHCFHRADESIGTTSKNKLVKFDTEGGDDWVATENYDENAEIDDLDNESKYEEVLSINPKSDSTAPSVEITGKEEEEDDDEEIPDMDDFEGDNLLEEDDPATLKKNEAANEDNIVKTRTYDITLTYDKYHQTPKVWLFGYNENGQPLKPEEVFSDISQSHAQKTVTIEIHPHTGIASAYIHPCKHASVMKKMLTNLAESQKTLRVDQYLFLFLKFMSAVMPTIEYDNTFAMDG